MPEPYRREIRVAPDTALELTPNELINIVLAPALRNLYADAAGNGYPGISVGRVDSWRVSYGRDPHDWPFGGMLLTVEADVSERRLPVTAAFMESEITRLLMTRRDDDDG